MPVWKHTSAAMLETDQSGLQRSVIVRRASGVLPAMLLVHSSEVPCSWEEFVYRALRDVVCCGNVRNITTSSGSKIWMETKSLREGQNANASLPKWWVSSLSFMFWAKTSGETFFLESSLACKSHRLETSLSRADPYNNNNKDELLMAVILDG